MIDITKYKLPKIPREVWDDINGNKLVDDNTQNFKVFGDNDKDGILNFADRQPNKKNKNWMRKIFK